MSKKEYRQYTEEFKLEALGLLKSSGKKAAQLERDLGITKGLLLKWRDKYQVKETGTTKKLDLSDIEGMKKEMGSAQVTSDDLARL